MSLLRNKEIRRLALTLPPILAAGTLVAGLVVSPAAAVVTGVTGLALGTAFFMETFRRYRQIARLSDYLIRVGEGDYSLDLRDHTEGELSILKSEIHKVTLALRERGERLQLEKSRLADALSDISHQIKTPLTSLFVLTDLLSDDTLDDARRAEFNERVQAQLERVRWLVESLLKLSRLDAGAVPLRAEPVRPADLVRRAAAPVRIPMELRGQTLEVRVDDIPFDCDVNWTAEALTNLLKNGMEHTPDGGTVRVDARTNPLYTEFTVTDTGSGIAPQDLPYVFNRFYRGADAGGDRVGIGLAMAKTIAEAQGGSIAARNGPDGGAVFTLRFPRKTSGESREPGD